MNDHTLVAMFLFAALDATVVEMDNWSYGDAIDPLDLPDSLYEQCGVGAVEAARNLSPLCDELLLKFNPEHPFCDLLYTDCERVAGAIVEYMQRHKHMPTDLTNLELSKCLTLNCTM